MMRQVGRLVEDLSGFGGWMGGLDWDAMLDLLHVAVPVSGLVCASIGTADTFHIQQHRDE